MVVSVLTGEPGPSPALRPVDPSMPPPAKLAVEVVVSSRVVPGWVADAIDCIRDAEDATVARVVVLDDPRPRRPSRIARLLLGSYDRIDDLVFGQDGDVMQARDLGPSVGRTATGDGSQVDIVLRLDDGAVQTPVTMPRFGIWTMEHAADLRDRKRASALGLAPGAAEMLLGRTITTTRLVATTATGRHVLGQVVSRVDRVSARRGARGHAVKLPSLIARTLHRVREDSQLPSPSLAASDGSTDGVEPRLGTSTVALGLSRIVTGYVRGFVHRKFAPPRWVVAVARGDHEPRPDDGAFRFLHAPDGRDWADPFQLETPDARLLFVEEYLRSAHRGRLAVVELDDSARGWCSVDTILDQPTHLSYPFVFRFQDQWYLLPEQAATGRLELYVADAFPRTWRWHSTALSLPASDATIAEVDGRWWMFTAIRPRGGSAADEMHIFHAESPLGPWIPHKRNPVVSDIRYARSAGRVYEHEGAWYRVAQDGAVNYGHSIAIIRIDRVDTDEYRESLVDVIQPDWAPGLMGTHTINRTPGLTVVDAMRAEPRIRWLRQRGRD